MDLAVHIERLGFDYARQLAVLLIKGDLGGRTMRLQLEFSLNSKELQGDLREVMLLEAQQVLRSAATVTLPALPIAADPD